MLMTVGIALALRPTTAVVGAAALFGLIVGALKVAARNRGMLETLLPTVAAFVVAAVALTFVKYGIAASPLRLLIASLVTFLPGGVLAIAIMDLAYGDIVSGASRFITGIVQLLFLVLGMTIAASLVGLPAEQLLVEFPDQRLVPWALWFGVLCFGVGTALHYSAAPRALPWILVVLAVAMGGQLLGNAAFGGYMSGFVGALAVTPVAYLIQYRLGGPAAMITFFPALWLLVPGSLGLVGLAEFAGAQSPGGDRELHHDAVLDRRHRAGLADRFRHLQRALRSHLRARGIGGDLGLAALAAAGLDRGSPSPRRARRARYHRILDFPPRARTTPCVSKAPIPTSPPTT